MPSRAEMRLEEVGGEIAHEFVGVAAFDQRDPLCRQFLEFDRADLGAVLVALRTLLRLLVAVELAIDTGRHAVEDVGDVDQSRSSRSGSSRVSPRVAMSASKISASAPCSASASGSGRGSGSPAKGR